MQQKEIREIIISAVVLALAFAIALSGGYQAFLTPANLPFSFAIALATVSIAFILHEMGHRFFARRYGYHAEFKMWPTGLMIALVFSVFGFVFAAPGAVMIYPVIDAWGMRKEITKTKMGIISLAGPVINIVLAGIFIAFNFLAPNVVFMMAASINVWLALFNALPIPPLDGSKIFAWNKAIWLAVMAVAVGLMIF